jgi:hypothetical protein
MDTATQVHQSAIEVLIACTANDSPTFGELLARLPGVCPSDAAAALERLTARQVIDPAAAERLNPRGGLSAVSGALLAGHDDDVLPQPHPLDYDWRFTSDTARWLSDRCVQLSEQGDTIALLGMPTVLKAAAARPHGRRWALLEASTATTAVLEKAAPRAVLRCDLARDDLPHLAARVVAADPPWYPDHTRVFLWAAAQISRIGATILIAQPGAGTRPGILAERSELLAYASDCGLTTARISSGTLEYACPPFERFVLERSGLAGAVPPTWRRGDLIELRHTAARQPERPRLDDLQSWREVILDRARLRFRLDPGRHESWPADPRLIQLVDGDILASVSRRNPARPRVAVWTGSNRVFGCRAPRLLAAIAGALAGRSPAITAAEAALARPADTAEQALIEQAAAQLIELARAESETGHAAGNISRRERARHPYLPHVGALTRNLNEQSGRRREPS